MCPAVKSLDEMENLFSNTLPIEQLIFLELRDCDNTAGTPLYDEHVETLLRTVNSHHKSKKDNVYQKELKEAITKILDPQALLHNARCNAWNVIPVKMIELTDYKKLHIAALNFLARRNITFKDERIATL